MISEKKEMENGMIILRTDHILQNTCNSRKSKLQAKMVVNPGILNLHTTEEKSVSILVNFSDII